MKTRPFKKRNWKVASVVVSTSDDHVSGWKDCGWSPGWKVEHCGASTSRSNGSPTGWHNSWGLWANSYGCWNCRKPSWKWRADKSRNLRQRCLCHVSWTQIWDCEEICGWGDSSCQELEIRVPPPPPPPPPPKVLLIDGGFFFEIFPLNSFSKDAKGEWPEWL